MNKPLRVFLVLGMLALSLGLMALLGYTSGSRRALQKYKDDLRAKGEKLSFAELAPSPQSFISDSLIAFTNAMGRLSYSRLSPGGLELRKFVGPGQARALWKENKPFGNGSGKGGLSTDWQEFAAEMEKYRQP